MIKIDTELVFKNKQFETKSTFKDYCVSNFVPEGIDPLRIYNFNLMEKYGDGFFYLEFFEPNRGKLNHIYQTQEEYIGSVQLRNSQKEVLESNGIEYIISEPYEFTKNALTIDQYYSIHTNDLVPLPIKIDVELFKLEMERYEDKYTSWGDLYTQYPRYAIPLVNLNGKLDNQPEPACYPLDRWNFIETGRADTKEEFDEYLFSISQFSEDALFETDFTHHTELMNLRSLNVLDPIKEYMTRSCILKWDTLGHFNPHFDTWHPTRWLRLWGTTDPDKMKLRYKVEHGKPNIRNKVKDKWERYEEATDIEAGRLYLHDSLKWHDGFAYSDDAYQFFISLNLDSYETIKGMI